MARVLACICHHHHLAGLHHPTHDPLARRQPPVPNDLALDARGQVTDQFLGFRVHQPDRGGLHPQQLTRLIQNDQQHLIQIDGGAERLPDAVDQRQFAVALPQLGFRAPDGEKEPGLADHRVEQPGLGLGESLVSLGPQKEQALHAGPIAHDERHLNSRPQMPHGWLREVWVFQCEPLGIEWFPLVAGAFSAQPGKGIQQPVLQLFMEDRVQGPRGLHEQLVLVVVRGQQAGKDVVRDGPPQMTQHQAHQILIIPHVADLLGQIMQYLEVKRMLAGLFFHCGLELLARVVEPLSRQLVPEAVLQPGHSPEAHLDEHYRHDHAQEPIEEVIKKGHALDEIIVGFEGQKRQGSQGH